ncbi:hypothetical protein WJX81_008242 [Elliptochloris bilobata]|uniref:Cytochrome P450 n=1 Tax=Elliptochloris bilobata TaxID=381761 RepID=A0AAW1SM27_9CHLO
MAFDMVAAALCVTATVAGMRFAAWCSAYLALRGLPGPKGDLVLGQLKDVVKPDHHRTLFKWACQYGGIYRIRLAHIHAVVVTDPQLIAVVLGKDTEIEKSIEGVYSHFNTLLHAGGEPNIFTSHTDAYWRLVRKGVAPAFSAKSMRQGFAHVLAVNQQLVSILAARAGAAVDMDNAALRVTLDVIGRVGFGKDFGATADLDDCRANAAFDLMSAGRDEGIKRWNNPFRKYLVFIWPSQSVRKGRRKLAAFQALMAGLLAEVRARGEPAADDASIAAQLLRIRDPATGRPLPDDRLAAEIGVFFTGGFETTGHTIAWALLMISQHAEVEARVLAELHALRLLPHQPGRRTLDFEDLARLTYTGQAIKEAMRLMPVLTDGTNRTTLRATQLGVHSIPAGTMVWVPFGATFASPQSWERPGEYLPERWDDADADYARPTGGEAAKQDLADRAAGRAKRFMPFSLGSRDCVGQSLARMNFTATVAMLLSEFSFRLADEMDGMASVRERATSGLLTLQPADGLLMHCTPRGAEVAASC